MGIIKTLQEFINENDSDSLSIKRDKIEGTEHGVGFSWILNDREIGEMLVSVDKGRASIVLYSRYKHVKSPNGIGYTFIKMCIDSLLEEGLDVVSNDISRSPGANLMWQKLARDYKVQNSTHRGSPCKIIYSK